MQPISVAVVGAGPIGLELAVALKKARVNYMQFDAGQIGQTIWWYPHQARFFSSPQRIAIAGAPLQTSDQSKATREEYLAYLRAVVQQFDLSINTFERVVALQRPGRESVAFTLRTQCGGCEKTYEANNVVLAVGDMHRPQRLNIEGEDLPHVSHYFNDPHPYFRRRLLIVGGRNSAVEAALRCHRSGARVSLSYRRDKLDPAVIKYWLLPEINHLITSGEIAFFPHTRPLSITPAHVRLGGIESDKREEDVPADAVLLLTGYAMDMGLFEMAGVSLQGENQAPLFDPCTMQTNVPGLYVAGTAAAGTQRQFRLFIENCHVHVERIVAAITGQALVAPASSAAFELPES